MSWTKKIREIREKNLAKKKEIKTGAEADGGSEAPQLPSHAPDNKVDLTATPEKDKRLNPIFLYGGGGLFLIILCAVMFSSCFHDDRGDRRKPSAMTVQGDVLNDQSVQQIEMKNLKQMNDEAQANAKGGKKNAQDGKTKPTKEENTVVEKKTARSSAGASSAKTEKKKELAELLSSASFLKREKAKKELSRRIGHIVRKEEEKTIEELLLRSLKSDEEFSKTIESYAQLYGDSVRTMNGLIEILSNRSYIQRFRQFEKRKGLSMEHPLIKKGLRDRRYAQSRMEEFSLYDKEYQRIKSKINHYITFFLDDRRDFLHMDMKKMLLFFQRKEEGSYPLFSQYALFLKESKEISMPLQLVLRRRILSGEKLLHLRRDYLLSLLFSLYQEERKNRKDEEEEWLSKRELYLEEVQKIPETLPLFLKEKLKRMRGRKTRDIFFQDTYQRVEELTKRGESIEQEDITTTLPALYPLLLAKREDLPMLSSEMVDILIVEDSKGLPDSALLLALTSARKVLFLEKAEEEDLRISGYEQSSIDRPSLYLSFYDRRMDKNILDFFRTILEEKEEELVLDEKIFPYLLLKKEKEEKEVLFFDLLIPPELEEETDLDLREFFSFVDHLPARDIDMVEQYLQMRKKA